MKTAVNYLEDSLKLRKDGGDMYQFCIFLDELQEIIEQAKDMEKEQLKQLMWDRTHVNETLINKGLLVDNLFDNYWNETFKSE
jgi:hypothetical protein